jgi:hypothetical protein
MAGPFDLTGQNIENSYQRILQTPDGVNVYDGTGSAFTFTAIAVPSNPNTSIQFNGNGLFSGSSNFTFNSASNTVVLTGSLNLSGSFDHIGDYLHTGSVYHSGSKFLTGIFSQTGSMNITGSTTQIGTNNLLGNTTLSGSIIISGSTTVPSTPTIKVYGDMETNGVIKFMPVDKNIDTSISASYIYVSGSTNDLYFSQNGASYNNVTRLRWLEGNLYTGLLHGGLITSASSTTFNISSGSGIVVNLNASLTDDPYPTITFVQWGNLLNQPLLYRTTDIQTFLGIDASGNIIQQITPWIDGQYNTSISLGTVLHQNLSTINGTITYPNVAYGYKQRSYDFIKAFGPLKISGYTLNTSSSLGLTVGNGIAFAEGRNYQVDPNNPSYITDPGTSVSKIFRYYQSGSSFVQDTNAGAGYAGIDTTQFNLNGSGSLTGVSPSKFYVQRIFWYPNSATKGIVAYYGLSPYDTLDEAQNKYVNEPFIEVPNTLQNAVFLGIVIIKGNANFTSTNDYRIVQSGLFRAAGTGGGGSSGGATTLSALTDVSIPSAVYGDLLMKDGSVWINTKQLSGSYTITGSLAISGGLGLTVSDVNGNSLDANNRWLIANSFLSVDWGNRTLNDSSGNSVADWVNKTLTGNRITVDWGNTLLQDNTAANPSIDWEQRYLYANDGTTVHLDWSDLNNLAFPSIQENPITRIIGTDDSGRVWYTASSAIGGGGSTTNPGGSNTQIQYNNSNAFGGVPTLTYDGTTLRATGSFTGSFVGSLTGTASWADNVISASYAATSSRLNAANTSIFAASSNRMVITASNGIIMNAGSVGVSLESGITITGNVLPGPPITNNTSSWSLGSPTLAWKDLYVSNGSVYFISGSNTASISFINGAIDFGTSPVIIPSSSTVPTASFAETASFLLGSVTSASYAATASILLGSVTSASYAATASYINNGVSFAGSGSIITGSTAISSSYGLLISANTFTVGDMVRVHGVFTKPIAGTSTSFYIYVNTSNTLSGATQLALFNTTTNRWIPITRTLSIESPTSTTLHTTTLSTYNDEIATNTAAVRSSVNIDWSADQYLLFAADNATLADRTDTFRFYAKKI